MTNTIQPRSQATLSKAENDLNQTEDNKTLLLAVFDSMNKLSEKINRINYLVQRKDLEQILFQGKKGGEEK